MLRKISEKFSVSRFKSEKGQLLVEVLVSVAVGGALLIAATAGIVGVVRQGYESRSGQTSSAEAYNLANRVRSFANSSWLNVFNLAKGSSTSYYLISGATSTVAAAGTESFLSSDIQSGLVGNWKFDEATGTVAYDSSESGSIGTLVNSPTRQTGTNCQVGGCLHFTSSSSQYVTSTPSGSLSGTFTVMAWGRPDTTATMDLLGTRSPGAYSFDMKFTGGNLIHADIGSGSAWITTAADASFNYSAGSWYHIAYVVTPTGYTVYANGNSVGSGTYTTSTPLLYNSTHYVFIGQYGGGEYFSGNIDDVRVYNRALSANEISQIYNSSVYTRYFYINNVSRDTNGNIESTYNANNDDPSTQQLIVVVQSQDGRTSTFNDYLTRARRDAVFNQIDWSGGGGQETAITSPNSLFSTSTNITFSSAGSLQLTSYANTGTLYSSTFDTQAANGAAFNSLLWQGTQPAGTSVQFQLATANSTSGSGGDPTGAIDTIHRYAWNDLIGWVDFGYATGSVQVASSQLTGYAYNNNVGEISLDCGTSPGGNICATSNYKVSRDSGTGDLSGWAWNDEIGWISFNCSDQGICATSNYKVNVSLSNGYFSGYAWNDNVGWISFNCQDTGLCGVSSYWVQTQETGGWKYIGPDGTNLTYYAPLANASSQITLKFHNNYRYVRYKVILSPDSGHTTTPTINGISINWSP